MFSVFAVLCCATFSAFPVLGCVLVFSGCAVISNVIHVVLCSQQ